MTDLLTVFLGFGIFNANCAARLTKWQNDRKQGWSMQRLGYLPEFMAMLWLGSPTHGERDPKMGKTPFHQCSNLLQEISGLAGKQ